MISAIIAACVVMVLAVAQIIVSFEVGPVIRQELERSNQNSLIMQKHMDYDNFDLDVANAKSLVEVGEGDIQAFLNTGYKGNVFELTTFGLCTSSYYTLFQQSSGKSKIRNNFYIGETLGTLITTEENLTDVFGVNGELNVLCGNLNETPGGVIITDYFADCIFSELKIYNQPYDLLLGPFKNKQNHVDGYINAVIYTGYKEKYQELIDYIRSIPSSQLSSITKDERFVRAYDEIVQYLGICYSVNPDFKIACMDSSVKNYVTTG
jgi:hypothetical protein